MKKILYFLLFFSAITILGQSKKKQIIELKSELDKCKIDKSYIENGLSYEKTKNVRLSYDKSNLETKISILTSEKDSFEIKVKSLEKKVKSLKGRLSILEQEIEVKQESIARLLGQIDSLAMGERDSIKINNDFLNNYFVNRQNLRNHLFSFRLDKVLLPGDNYYSNAYYKSFTILDINQFYIAQKVARNSKRLKIKPISFLNTLMPDFQILNNKFLTLKKKNGEVENLLFDLTNFDFSRDFFNIQLTPEESKNTKVMNWNLVRIDNEIYITFNTDIFHRMLGDSEFNFGSGYKITSEYNYKSRSYLKIIKEETSYYGNAKSSQMFLVRKKNRNLNNDIAVKNPIFLFKLIVSAVLSWVAFLILVAILNDFNILNPQYNIYYYLSTFIVISSLTFFKK